MKNQDPDYESSSPFGFVDRRSNITRTRGNDETMDGNMLTSLDIKFMMHSNIYASHPIMPRLDYVQGKKPCTMLVPNTIKYEAPKIKTK